MTLATPERRSGHGGPEDGGAVLNSIRQYWELLSVNERQQVLFLDEPELVKQLYKLNLSLLCVGLMQRHLKTGRSATDKATDSKKLEAATATASTAMIATASSTSETQDRAASTPSTRATTDTSSEKTYELLEAMEFMDIGTGMQLLMWDDDAGWWY
jgi:hypothetical protein